MKAINRSAGSMFIGFDLGAPIWPSLGLGGFSFSQTIGDFETVLINKSLDRKAPHDFDHALDDQLFSLTISTKNNEIEIVIDLFSGKINSMACRAGYLGKLQNDIGIGSSIIMALSKDSLLGFNLDTDWFDRTPFDGLIIYPPADLKGRCIDAAINGTDFPDFDIQTIELIDLDFAKEHFSDGRLIFETE